MMHNSLIAFSIELALDVNNRRFLLSTFIIHSCIYI